LAAKLAEGKVLLKVVKMVDKWVDVMVEKKD